MSFKNAPPSPSGAMSNCAIITGESQATGHRGLTLPAIIMKSGPRAARRVIEFFTAEISNPNTRAAYGYAVASFSSWCEEQHLRLEAVSPVAVAAYLEQVAGAIPTRKQHLAAIRHLFDYLVTGHIIEVNPAHSVRGPKYVVKKGKTPVLTQEDARRLLESIDLTTIAGLRDRALLGVMFYSFARVSAVTGMNVEDYYPNGKRWWFRLHEKGGKFHEVPTHHKAEEYMDAYLAAAGIAEQKRTPLFRSLDRQGRLTDRPLVRQRVLEMVKRRARHAGIPSDKICCHTARATGITAFLLEGGTVEAAQRIAAHESPRTTSLYDRTGDAISLEEVERVRF
jgi:integrase/recombinase XerD